MPNNLRPANITPLMHAALNVLVETSKDALAAIRQCFYSRVTTAQVGKFYISGVTHARMLLNRMERAGLVQASGDSGCYKTYKVTEYGYAYYMAYFGDAPAVRDLHTKRKSRQHRKNRTQTKESTTTC